MQTVSCYHCKCRLIADCLNSLIKKPVLTIKSKNIAIFPFKTLNKLFNCQCVIGNFTYYLYFATISYDLLFFIYRSNK